MDIVVIGAGVVGCAVARELSSLDANVIVLERTYDVAMGASKANSGIVHAGFDAKIGSVKAKFNVDGARLFPALSKELDFPYRNNGAFVLNFSSDGEKKLYALLEQGKQNGVKNLSILSGEEVRKQEPNVSKEVLNALYAPTSGIVSPYEMTIAYAENACTNGVRFDFNVDVESVEQNHKKLIVKTNKGNYNADVVVNCAGIFSDKINNSICSTKYNVIARKGEYMLMDKMCGNLTYATLFQLPTDMGKGVLVSPTTHGNIIVGPTAKDTDNKQDTDTTQEGLNTAFMQAQKSIPSLSKRTIITQFTGLRAHSDKDDFVVGETDVEGFYNCLGIESPGLTSAPAIGKYIAKIIKEKYSLSDNPAFMPTRKSIPQFAKMSDTERKSIIEKNPLYGKVVCRCEMVTEGEIVEAIRRSPSATDIDGIKRRTRAGMGRCQAGFCTLRIMEILAREKGVELASITKNGEGSEMITGKVKGEQVR